MTEYLAALPGYQELFGSLSFCDCQESQSILGPAAYFVDLMKYIDENCGPSSRRRATRSTSARAAPICGRWC